MPPQDEAGSFEERLEQKWARVESTLEDARQGHPAPVYLSSDVRDAGYKTANVDTNAFPAGFNNLCPRDRDDAATHLRAWFDTHHPAARRVLLLPEKHTRNPHYLHNVDHLARILDKAGIDHRIGSSDPEIVYAVQGTATPEGHILHYDLVVCKDGALVAGQHPVDLVLSNNDFTTGAPRPLRQCSTPVVPPPGLGWATRTKSKHFRIYNHLAGKVARAIGEEPWRLSVETERAGPIDFKKREGLEKLATTVDKMIDGLEKRNQEHGIDDEARVFIKDDAGTYGMGIMVAATGDEVRHMNNRARQKMDKGKYGHKVHHVIVQEAVPTKQRHDDTPAETVVYMIGTSPIGGFMRVHEKRGENENLNQPGMRFLPLCPHGCNDPLQRECVERGLTKRETLAARLAAVTLMHEATPVNLQTTDPARVTLPQ